MKTKMKDLMKNNNMQSNKIWLITVQLIVLSLFLVLSQLTLAKDRIQYHVQNFDGSTLKVINEQGVVSQSYQYAPFGQQLQYKKPSNLKNPNAFVGGVQDADDLVYLKQRHYNPVLGRFYQPDPVTFIINGDGQLNRYHYAWNDSYTFSDSSGEAVQLLAFVPLVLWVADNFRSDIPNANNIPPSGIGDAALAGYGLSSLLFQARLASMGVAELTYYNIAQSSASISPLVLSRSITNIDPAKLLWTQRSAGGNGRADILRESMSINGYKGPPIDVVQYPYGLVTLDHTRAAVALEQGIKSIPAIIRTPNELLPQSMIGRFGNATTWGEAVIFRTANQRPPLAPQGTVTPPRLPKTKN